MAQGDEEDGGLGRGVGREELHDIVVVKGEAGGAEAGLRAGIKIFNVTNHDNPRDIQDNITSPYFGALSNSIGRIYRGKFEFQF